MSVGTNTNEATYVNPSTSTIVGGVVAGGVVSGVTKLPHCLVATKTVNNMQKLSSSLTPDEFVQVEKAISSALKESGVAAKGVSIVKYTSQNADEISMIINKEIDKSVLKYLPKNVKEKVVKSYLMQLEDGMNAFCVFKANKILRPEKDLALTLFHEIGHSINATSSKLGKILQKCRPMSLLALPISAIALIKTKKAPREEPQNGTDKAMTFVKNNAGKLTFAAFLPVLFEEGLATIRGNKLAKQTLNADLAKKVAKANTLGFSTYLLMATLSGLGIFLGTKVKDSIASKKLATENI